MRVFVPSAAALLTDRHGHGEGLIAWHLLRGLAARGHEIVACARAVDLDADAPFDVVETGPASRRESLEPLAYARLVTRVLRRLGGPGRFDVVHWLFPEHPGATLYAPPRGTPFVLGPLFPAWPGGRTRPLRGGDAVAALLAPLARRRRAQVLDAAARILLSSPAALDGLPPSTLDRTRLLPIGVDPARFTPAPLPAQPRILFVGRLDRTKGVRDLVEAFDRVRRRVPAARLVVAGEGPEREWVRERANGAVALLGAVSHADVPALLRDASVVCLPSHGEPYGMAVLEAMAAGRAVVAADAGGPRHLVDERGGTLVPPGDPARLATALADLLVDTRRLARMGRFNRERLEREHSLECTLDGLEAAYREAAA